MVEVVQKSHKYKCVLTERMSGYRVLDPSKVARDVDSSHSCMTFVLDN